FAVEFWQACEPGLPGPFGRLDRHLLRLGIERIMRGTYGPRRAPIGAKYSAVIRSAVASRTPSGVERERWARFLLRADEPANLLITDESAKAEGIERPRHHIQVMARATLLLRVALGACARLVRRSGASITDLEF